MCICFINILFVFYLIFVPGLGHAPLNDRAMVARIERRLSKQEYPSKKYFPNRNLKVGKRLGGGFRYFLFSNLTNMFKGVGTTN